MDERDSDGRRLCGEDPRTHRVDRVGRIELGLRPVDISPGGAVDDPVEAGWLTLEAPEQSPHALCVGDVDLGQVDGDGLPRGPVGCPQHIVPEHSQGPCDEDPHRIEMSELSPTMKR